jgi:formylglycine-generating enzyme required for sulfatase activity
MGMSDRQIDWLVRHTDWAGQWQEQGRFEREQPRHSVILPAYAIGRHPVTVGEFRAFVDAGGYQIERYWTDAGWAWCQAEGRASPDYWDDDKWTADHRLPVVGVSWYEADGYCRWLSEVKGRAYRLPGEGEWERAARGMDGRLHPWGDVFDASRCNTWAGGLHRTTPVGQYSPAGDSPDGCADMVGNVSEWTLSRFRPYPYAAGDGRNEPEGTMERATRGGSWHSPDFRARATSRGMNDPFFRDNDLGFRCVRVEFEQD